MSEPAAKRQRTEDAPITRSEIWYSDGSVVLQADNTQFRVHFSILALNSAFFRDMQGLPQPPDQPTVEGCPVVELPDDVADVKYLLQALYTPTLLDAAVPFPLVASLVRLGRKYDFKDLLASAVARLTYEYPTTLDEYIARQSNPPAAARILPYKGITMDVVNLAIENNISTILPSAYGRLLSYSLEQLLDGISRSNGTSSSLSPSNLRTCVVGRQHILVKQYQPQQGLGWTRKWEFDDCEALKSCSRKREAFLRTYMDRQAVSFFTTNVVLWASHFCVPCAGRINESINVGTRKMWEELPSFFNLPPWAELKNDL
ncbi:hypothetical protein C8R46DRAFT_1055465 [Mycena filopes]|nr:hypothetical protein C8R46DRAFT_1055465 [Mycena filopes]